MGMAISYSYLFLIDGFEIYEYRYKSSIKVDHEIKPSNGRELH